MGVKKIHHDVKTTLDKTAIHGLRFRISGNTTGSFLSGSRGHGLSTVDGAVVSGTSPGLFTVTLPEAYGYAELLAGPFCSLQVRESVAGVYQMVPVSSSISQRSFQFLVTSGTNVPTEGSRAGIPNGVLGAVAAATASIWFIARNTNSPR